MAWLRDFVGTARSIRSGRDAWDTFVAFFVPRPLFRLQRRLRYGPWLHRSTSACDTCPFCNPEPTERTS